MKKPLLAMSFAFLGLSEAAASSIRVCNTGGDYQTVKNAISAANSNTGITEIRICPGVYDDPKKPYENHTLKITRPDLVIKGESGKAEDVTISYKNTVFLIERTNVTLENLTIKSSDDHGIQIENKKTSEGGSYNFRNLIILSNDYGIYGVQSKGDYELNNLKIKSTDDIGIYFNGNAAGNYKLQNIDIESKGSSIYFDPSITSHQSSFNKLCLDSKDDYGMEFNNQFKNASISDSYFRKSADGGILFAKKIENVSINRSHFASGNKYSIQFQNGTDGNSSIENNCFLSSTSGSHGSIFAKNYWSKNNQDTPPSSSLASCPITLPSSCFDPSPPTEQALPGSFNAFDTNTPKDNTSGFIETKTADDSFSLSIVSLKQNTNGNADSLASDFSGKVKVQLIASNQVSPELDGNSCPAQGVASNTFEVEFTKEDAGRIKETNFSESALSQAVTGFSILNKVWKNVRVKITYPATGDPQVIACSTDNFAIRPAYLQVSAHDDNWEKSGTARNLSASGVVHKAGKPFRITVTPYNAKDAVISNYEASPGPTVASSQCAWPAGFPSSGEVCTQSTLAPGAWKKDGASLTAEATYSEAGNLRLTLEDTTFAQVDQEMEEVARTVPQQNAPLVIGRFVPDHFTLDALNQPAFRTFGSECAQRSFTYIGQPFSYASHPRIQVSARNAQGNITTNHRGSHWDSLAVAQTYASSPPLTAPSPASVSLITGAGTAQLDLGKGDQFVFARNDAAPQPPFEARISLQVEASQVFEGTGQGNNVAIRSPAHFFGNTENAGMAFDAGPAFRHGQLHLANAHGSDRLDLPVPLSAQYWDGSRFVLNADDHCTAVPAAALAFSAWQGSLQSNAASRPGLPTADPAFTLQNGRSQIVLQKPSAPLPAPGGATLCLNLDDPLLPKQDNCREGSEAGLPWLKGPPLSPPLEGLRDPDSRVTFGVFKSGPVIYRRENY